MSRIFISYRRGDTNAHAGRIYDRLSDRFGEEGVFMDVDDIEPGVDFVDYIEQAVGSCDVLIAVIGRDWSDARDADGRRRLDDPSDFVRLEVAAGLEREVRVIPVLVEGARMPSAHELPEPLAFLARRNALEISDTRWRHDIGRLVDTIEKVLDDEGTRTALDSGAGQGTGQGPPQAQQALPSPSPAPPPTSPAPPPAIPPTAPPFAAEAPPVTPPVPVPPAPAPETVAGYVSVNLDKRANAALWLGIGSLLLGVIAVGIFLGVPAVLLGRSVRKATDSEPGSSRRSKATVGFWTGIVGSAMTLVWWIAIGIFG